MTDIQHGTAQARLARAMSTMQSGNWRESEAICRQLLAESPALAEANYLLGVICENTQRTGNAVAHYEAVLKQTGNHPGALINLGAIRESRGNHSEALDCYRRAVAADPRSLPANYNLGRMLRTSGQPARAVTHLAAALAMSPDSVQVLHEIALACKAQSKYSEALVYLQRARGLAPSDPGLCNVTGNVFQSQGEIEQAIRSYREAITLKEDFAAAFNNLGSALVARGDVPAALESYRTAIGLRPDQPGAASNLLLAENYVSDNPEELFAHHRQYGVSLESRTPVSAHEIHTSPEQKIRVGYLSPDFRQHSVAYFLKALFANHNHGRFHIACFSDVTSPDDMTHELKSVVAEWHDVTGLSDGEVFQLIRDRGIDILVDLAGHTAHNRLPVFAMQAAPVQASYLGYPNTTGLSAIQYRFTDAHADPPGAADAHFTETLIRLPGCFLSYTPSASCPAVGELPADNNGTITYGSFNVLAKISDACIDAWSAILKQTPDARLLLKSAGLQDRVTRDYINDRFVARGVSADRIELIARTADFRSHMSLYNRVDISLDTFPYNGTTTTCESLWMGVPVISLAGARHASRVGSSLLHQAGLDELVARTTSDYVSKATQHAGNIDRLRALRSRLRARIAASPLCDGVSLAAAIEDAFEKMLA